MHLKWKIIEIKVVWDLREFWARLQNFEYNNLKNDE